MLRAFIVMVVILLIVGAGGAYAYWSLVTAPRPGTDKLFIVSHGTTSQAELIHRLVTEGHVRSEWALTKIIEGKQIQPGGYELAAHMDVYEVARVVTSPPHLRWVLIPEGLRKEEIGERLAKALGWSPETLKKWDDFQLDPEHLEGVFFPDTYLIPLDETPEAITHRMVARFNAQFAGYPEKFAAKNIQWTTGLRLASLIQREAAGTGDMPLISGIIWNRLDAGIPLQIDATVQYAKDSKNDLTTGFWKPLDPADVKLESRYNTYLIKGLPPLPIDSPGMAAIDAALNPEKTDCLFYIHDDNRTIHCAATYAQHVKNIQKYLDKVPGM